jgi:hypothetical protein
MSLKDDVLYITQGIVRIDGEDKPGHHQVEEFVCTSCSQFRSWFLEFNPPYIIAGTIKKHKEVTKFDFPVADISDLIVLRMRKTGRVATNVSITFSVMSNEISIGIKSPSIRVCELTGKPAEYQEAQMFMIGKWHQ